VNALWPEIMQVAQALAERGRLDGPEVDRLITMFTEPLMIHEMRVVTSTKAQRPE